MVGERTVPVVGLDLHGYLNGLDHLEGDLLGDMHGHLHGLDVLEGLGDGNVLNDGDLDGYLDGVGLGHQLQLGGDGGVVDTAVGLGVHVLGVTVHRLRVSTMVATVG